MTAMPPVRLSARTIWLSDIHLGNRDCCASHLLDFLRVHDCDTLYLVGDIIDFWALKRQFIWPPAHYEVVRAIMRKAQSGTRVIYVPGNHDAVLREFIGQTFGPVEIVPEVMHETAAGRRLLVLHGDRFDGEVQLGLLSRLLGHHAYGFLMWANRWCNRVRSLCHKPYWSLANHLKERVGNARAAIAAYEGAAIAEARRHGADGIVCGHIHRPRLRTCGAITYANTGDWTESCSALLEAPDGTLKLVSWIGELQPALTLSEPGVATGRISF
jgi:UDP-2,3-diacylglucosamine pyrophosphatase LpxH